ncbi:MAG TPA: 50S ribosomal protein L29 [Acidobacteriaceae bacterium]
METTRIRSLGDAELKTEEQKAAEQIFRLRFQLKLGQKEGVKKMRELKQAVARIKTVERERVLGIRGAKPLAEGQPESKGRTKARKGTR